MTFADAIYGLRDGYAAKRPSWGGYVKKAVTSTDTDPNPYTLTYKNRSGTEYVYTFNGTSWTAPSTTVPFDAELHAAMIADDWTVGTVADYEAARTGTGTW